MSKKIIGWEEYTVIEENVGINNEQYDTVTNYEPIFEVSEKEKKEIYEKAIKKWGTKKQLWVVVEEFSELIQSLSKSIRKNDIPKATENMSEEIADCLIMLEQLQKMFDIEKRVIEYYNIKLKRLEKLLCQST